MSASFDPYYEWLSIPPKDQPPNHYRLLGIELFESNRRVIAAAANRQMSFIKEYQAGEHSEITQQILNELSAARLCLLNTDKKAAYDARLRDTLKSNTRAARPPARSRQRAADPAAGQSASKPSSPKSLRVPMAFPVGSDEILPPAALDGRHAAEANALVRPSAQFGTPAATTLPDRYSGAPVDLGSLDDSDSALLRNDTLWDTDARLEPTCAGQTDRAAHAGFAVESLSIVVIASAAGLVIVAVLSLVLWAGFGNRTLGRGNASPSVVQERLEGLPTVESEDVSAHSTASGKRDAEPEISPAAAERDLLTGRAAPPLDPPVKPIDGADDRLSPSEGQSQPDVSFDAPETPNTSGIIQPASARPMSEQQPSAAASDEKHRPAVPDEGAQRASQALARQIYADRFREAQTADDKTALAKDMFEAAVNLPPGGADQYMTLKIARDVAAASGDARTALRVTEAMIERFDIDAIAMRFELLMLMAERTSDVAQIETIAQTALELVDGLVGRNQHDLALQICEAGKMAAQRAKLSNLSGRLDHAETEVLERQRQFDAYQQALDVLEVNPSDPSANRTAGLYLCFTSGDWQGGISLLSAGNTPEFHQVTALEQQVADSSEKQIATGDAWWSLADRFDGAQRDACLRRAAFWYEQAIHDLPAGLARLKVEQRLATLSPSNDSVTMSSDNRSEGSGEPTEERPEKVAGLVREAQGLIDRQHDRENIEARRILLRINQTDDGNTQANFYLGLLAATIERNHSDARRHFLRVLRSCPQDVACLNNLALVSLQLREIDQAVAYWQKTAELTTEPEVAHNVQLLFRLADRNRLKVSPQSRERLIRSLDVAKPADFRMERETGTRRRSPTFNGWMYMDYAGQSAVSEPWGWPRLADRTCLYCNGVGTVKCPVSACSRGRIRTTVYDTIRLFNGHVVKKPRVIVDECTNCRGTGRVPCHFCRDGIDRGL